jgi:hypothetical protein
MSPSPIEQVAAMQAWVSARADVLDYVIVWPHDSDGGRSVYGPRTVRP